MVIYWYSQQVRNINKKQTLQGNYRLFPHVTSKLCPTVCSKYVSLLKACSTQHKRCFKRVIVCRLDWKFVNYIYFFQCLAVIPCLSMMLQIHIGSSYSFCNTGPAKRNPTIVVEASALLMFSKFINWTKIIFLLTFVFPAMLCRSRKVWNLKLNGFFYLICKYERMKYTFGLPSFYNYEIKVFSTLRIIFTPQNWKSCQCCKKES